MLTKEVDLVHQMDSTSFKSYIEIQNLQNADFEIREATKEKLRQAGGDALPILSRALTMDDAAIRWEAASILARIPDPVCLPLLTETLLDPVKAIAWMGVQAILKFKMDGLRSLLSTLIEMPQPFNKNVDYVAYLLKQLAPLTGAQLLAILKAIKDDGHCKATDRSKESVKLYRSLKMVTNK